MKRWNRNRQEPIDQLAHEALEAFDPQAASDFLERVMQAAQQHPHVFARRRWSHRVPGLRLHLAPAATCLAVVLGVILLLSEHRVDWPFVVDQTPVATIPDATQDVVVETDLLLPVTTFASGLPVYYVMHRSVHAMMGQAF